MTPSEAVEEIRKQQTKILSREVTNLYSELQTKSPVDTGTFKGAWQLEKVVGGWKITNGVQYATILADGRRFVLGKWVGSEQFPEGIAPILAKYNIIIANEFKKIKV